MTRVSRSDAAAEAARRAQAAARRQQQAARAAAERARQNDAAERAHRPQASADVQSASRGRFAAQADGARTGSTCLSQSASAGSVKRGVLNHPEAGAQRIAEAAARIEAAGGDKDAARRATLDATRTVREVLAQTRDPGERKQLLESAHDSLGRVAKGLGLLDRDQTKRAVADLASAAESAGPGAVEQLTAPIAAALPGEVAEHFQNMGEFRNALSEAVADRGALLGASLAKQLDQTDPLLGAMVSSVTAEGMDRLRRDFADIQKEVGHRQAEIGEISAQWKGVLSPEQMQAGLKRFQAEHDEFRDRDAKAAALLRALDGAGYAATHGIGELADKARGALEQVPALADTDAGARAIGSALSREGRGEATFLRATGEVFDKDSASRARLAEAAQRAIVATQGAALSHGDTAGLVESLRGAQSVLPGEQSRSAMAHYAEHIEKNLTGLPADELALGLATSAKQIVGGVSDQLTANTEATSLTQNNNFRVFGATLGAVAVGQDIIGLRDGADAREAVGAVVDAAGLGTSIAAVALRDGAPRMLKTGLPVVGYALSAFDTARALQRGDELGAVAAAAPLAGAAAGATIGAVSGSVAPGVGTMIGGAVGGLVGLGIGVGRVVFGDKPDEKLEKSTQSFLQGAFEAGGMSVAEAEKASHRLRDVNGDFFGAGPRLQAIAKRTGESPASVLSRVAALDDDKLHDFVKAALDVGDNGEAIRDQQKRAAEGQKDVRPSTFQLDESGLDALVSRYRAL